MLSTRSKYALNVIRSKFTLIQRCYAVSTTETSHTIENNSINDSKALPNIQSKLFNESIKQCQQDQDEEDANKPALTTIEKDLIKGFLLPRYRSLKKYCDHAKSVPRLDHDLQRTLTSPGVHYQMDPRTGVSNFDENLLSIPPIDALKMDKISSFTPSSKDTKLLSIAAKFNAKEKKVTRHIKYFSSTSSMTSLLIKFHKLLSHNRPINTTMFSKCFPESTQFTSTSDLPTSLVVTKKAENIYSVDADRSVDTEITLSVLGNALELMLTKSPEEFQKYLKNCDKDPELDSSAYHYARIGNFMVRSQLDAVDPRLPGTGTFDIKTRAVCAIRMDLAHTDYFPTNYEITKTHGVYESFERELFDAARIVMFKYSLQARLGNMDGIFMAFHNIRKFLGYQYLPLSEIDNIFFGDYELDGKTYSSDVLEKKTEERTNDEVNTINQEKLQSIVDDFHNQYQTKREALSSFVADFEMRLSVILLQKLLDRITSDLDGKPFRVIFKKMKRRKMTEKQDEEPETYYSLVCVVNPLEQEELAELQMLAKDRVENNKHLVKDLIYEDMTPSERIKFFTEYVAQFRSKYFALNRNIMKSSESRMLAYEIKGTHIFNGAKCEDKYPFPSVEILDPKNKQTWDLEYEINSIDRAQEKKHLYNKFVKEIAFNAFRETEGVDMDVYTPEGVIYDENASLFQNVTRAYSAKATKRQSCK